MRIAIFDYKTIAGNPAGSCHRTMLRALAHEHEFTVFSVQFENPDPARIRWVRVPVPARPLALLFLCFHIIAPLLYLWDVLRTGKRFDLVQSVESNLSFGELIYAHFSHTTFLRTSPARRGLRAQLRWLDNWLHAKVERFRYPRATLLVAPSAGLAAELRQDFRIPAERVCVLCNPVRIDRMRRPLDFERAAFRQQLGFAPEDLVFAFAALGHFERKGLPLILEALQTGPAIAKVLIVGGEPDLIAHYQKRADVVALGDRVCFVGMQSDVRPYFWSADAFLLPSSYETFSLVTYEAAAASLPVIAPPLNGIRDLICDGQNGFLLDGTCRSVVSALDRIHAMTETERSAMGEAARAAAESFSEERFVESWRALYATWETVAVRAHAKRESPASASAELLPYERAAETPARRSMS